MNEMILEKKSLYGHIYLEMEICWGRTFSTEIIMAISIYK